MTATASAATASAATVSVDEDLDECGPQLITKLEVQYNELEALLNCIISCDIYLAGWILDTC